MLKKLIIIGLAIWAYSAHGQVRTTPCDSIGTQTGLCWSWTAPTGTTPAATYNLYQISMTGTTCAQFTPSTTNRIASGVTNIAYIQAGPSPAQNLCNEVTAVSSAGVEGPASTVATFLLPTPPGAPGSLQVVKK